MKKLLALAFALLIPLSFAAPSFVKAEEAPAAKADELKKPPVEEEEEEQPGMKAY